MSSKNVTERQEWQDLLDHYVQIKDTHIAQLFDQGDARADEFSIQLDELYFDYSKQKITRETQAKLCALASTCGLEKKRAALFAGEQLNTTENRPALHTALRGSFAEHVRVDGTNILDFVRETHQKMHAIYDDLNGRKEIKNIVNIGIGGSDLGPKMISQALQHYGQNRFHLHFLSNIDPSALHEILDICLPENTVFIIASKSFTTQETITNALAAKDWVKSALSAGLWQSHFYGITGNNKAALEFGVPKHHLLPLPDWVGGRYSLWGSIGLSILLDLGPDHFEALLSGARAADQHFQKAAIDQNIPVMMGLLGIWNTNFAASLSHAILPYDHNLGIFPSFVQQIDMESNGKSIQTNGERCQTQTGPVIFGETGTNGQHAFYQSLHQGTQIIPCDFIVAKKAHKDINRHQEILVANALGQARALMVGDQTPDAPHQYFHGDRPSNFFLFEKMTPKALGMLIALYEHKIFVQGVIWNINSFDQWGVQLGKDLANDILKTIDHNDADYPALDSSSRALLKHYLGTN